MTRSGVDTDADPTVSVVIPVYNLAAYVGAAIDSALGQDYPHMEVIVVDDGSTDDVGAVLERYGDRIVVATQENRGVGAARNRAVALSTGSIIALLDGDDVWYPERARRCVDVLRTRPDVAFVTTDADLINESGTRTGSTYLDWVPFPSGNYESQIVRENFVYASTFVWRHILDEVGGFDERPPIGTDDYDLWMRLIRRGYVPAIVAEPLAGYRLRSTSLSSGGGIVDAKYVTLERRLPEFWEIGVYGSWRHAMTIAWRLGRRGKIPRALRFVAAAFRDPGADTRDILSGIGRKATRRAGRWITGGATVRR